MTWFMAVVTSSPRTWSSSPDGDSLVAFLSRYFPHWSVSDPDSQ